MAARRAAAAAALVALLCGAAAATACTHTVFGFTGQQTGFHAAADSTPSFSTNCLAQVGSGVRHGYLITYASGTQTSCCTERGEYNALSGMCGIGCGADDLYNFDIFYSGDYCYHDCFDIPTDVCVAEPTVPGNPAFSGATAYPLDTSSSLNLNPKKSYTVNTGSSLVVTYGLLVASPPTHRRSVGDQPNVYCAGHGYVVDVGGGNFECTRNGCLVTTTTFLYLAFGGGGLAVGLDCYFDCYVPSSCAAGYTGATCEVAIDNCASAPCLHGGSCTSIIGDGTYPCTCPNGYSGSNCQVVEPLFCETQKQLNDYTAAVSNALIATGDYVTTAGTFSFFNINLCASPAVPGCLFQNAGEPYGLFQVPAGPYEPVHNASLNPPMPLPNLMWRLDQSEAIVVLGCTPPVAEYFGFTGYVAHTFNGSAWITPFGSLGDTLDNNRIQVFGSAPAASGKFSTNQVLVFTGDQNTFTAIQNTLGGMGIQPGAVNLLPIPAAGWDVILPNGQPVAPLKMGLEQFQDDFTMLLRIAYAHNATDLAAYTASGSPPLRILRVTPLHNSGHVSSLLGPAADSLIPRAPAPPTPTNSESGLATALATLVAAVKTAYNPYYTITTINTLNITYDAHSSASSILGYEVDFGAYCYGLGVACNADNRDAHYAATGFSPIFYPSSLAPGMFSMVIGVNHVASGLASYSNVVLYNLQKQLGVVGVQNAKFAGSANAFLSSTIYAGISSQFYAYKFQRNCASAPNNGGPYCTAVPAPPSFPGLGDYTPGQAATNTTGVGFFIERAYVNPQTGVGPTDDQILLPVHLLFVPRPPTAAPTTPAP